ncbi:MAG: TlpA family protein disulfide reductase [Pyrinomonadaceae bacterium]
MKRYSLVLMLFLIPLFAMQISAQEFVSAGRVMQKVADKLAAVKLLGYKYRFEYRYPSRESKSDVVAEAFLDLKPADGTSQFRFQFTNDGSLDAFNGAERFMLDKKNRKLFVETKPSFQSFGSIMLQNSPLSLKYALPRIIADAKISKKVTKIRNGPREQYLLEFSLYKGIINSGGEITQIRPDLTNKLQIKIYKATLLPVEVVQSNDQNDETITTSYTEITEKPAAPDALSWYFSTYQNGYALQSRDRLTLIDTGKAAPQFDLVSFANTSKVSLDQYGGKLVLLEFWIAHCGFCIAAVPKLNLIEQNYREKGIHVVSINMYDPAETIESFRKKNKPDYTILTGGESIAKAYGVGAYPAIILIGPDGRVLYASSGLQERELEDAIVANLKE